MSKVKKRIVKSKIEQPKLDAFDISIAKQIFNVKHGAFLNFDLTGCIKELLNEKAIELGLTDTAIDRMQKTPLLHQAMLNLARILTTQVTDATRPIFQNFPQGNNPNAKPLSIEEFERMGTEEAFQKVELQLEPEAERV